MNRIVLIGNGFDLAHGLPTSYQHFLVNYWQEWYGRLCSCDKCQLSDEFYEFTIKHINDLPLAMSIKRIIYLLNMHLITNRTWEQMITNEPPYSFNSFEDLVQLCQLINDYCEMEHIQDRIYYQSTSCLFEAINGQYQAKWVDIENEYYCQLKKVCDNCVVDEMEILNADISSIKDKLISYLQEIQANKITGDINNENIKRLLFEPFNLRDISKGGENMFLDYIRFEIEELPGGINGGELEKEMNDNPAYSIMNTREEAYREMIKIKLLKGELNDYSFPNRTLLLNFNYTNTAERLYAESTNGGCGLIYIHGKLNDPYNPIIFGYGDEMDEHYKKIVNLNNNDYLQNIKSIRYLETDNYRKLLSFMDDAPYQIYIMGHSCGNSDRTLLNTLFEHKNCLSIKPFYYIDKDGKDNYIDIVQNISRNFKDAALMRDRVVNKRYCEPLPQNETK